MSFEATGNDGISMGRQVDVRPAIGMLRRLDINANPVEYGRCAGEGFQAFLANWPTDIEGAKIHTDKGRFASPESFWGEWKKAETIVMTGKHQEVRQAALADKGGDETFKATIAATRADLEPLIEKAETGYLSDKRGYFVPYNADPDTCTISVDGDNSTVIAYYDPNGNGRIGRAQNKVLAEVTAASNFYGRLSKNPRAQQPFLNGLLSGAKSISELDQRAAIARSVATFGTIYFSKYPMDPKEPEKDELPMAAQLLASLHDNLEALQTAYQSQKDALPK